MNQDTPTESKINILVIDDKQSNLNFLTKMLCEKGYKVRVFSDGYLALKNIKVELPDLILLDIVMPDIDGYQVCKRLKDNPETRDIPIIFISGLEQTFDKIKAFELGGVDYITKPFEVTEVLARVDNQLEIHLLKSQLQKSNQKLKETIRTKEEYAKKIAFSNSWISNILNVFSDGILAMESIRYVTGEIKDFRCIIANKIVLETLGIEAEDIIGKIKFKKLIESIDVNIFASLVEVVETGETLQKDFCYTKNNQQIWYACTAVKLEDGLAITVRDISQNREMSRLLAEQNIQLQKEIAQRKKSEFTLRENLRQNVLLQQITEDIRSSLDIQHIFETAAQQIGQTFQVNRCIIQSYINEPIPIILYVAEYLDSGEPSIIDRENLLQNNSDLQIILSDQNIFFSDNVYQEKRLQKSQEFFLNRGVKSIMIIKTYYQSNPNGLIYLEQCNHHRQWTEEEVKFLEAVAAQLGIAIAQSNLLEQLKEANQKLEILANLDGLTQVSNRRHFDQVLVQEWRRMARDQNPLSLIMCDVDCFKAYNDCYGHQMGDDCLKKIAKTLANTIRRPPDLVARWGGEEFAIILPNTNIRGANYIAKLIREQVHKLAITHEESLIKDYVTISVGIASIIPPQTPLGTNYQSLVEQLIYQADQALYQAKQQGRDRIVAHE